MNLSESVRVRGQASKAGQQSQAAKAGSNAWAVKPGQAMRVLRTKALLDEC